MVLCLPAPLLLAWEEPGGGGGGCLCLTLVCGCWLVWWMTEREALLLRFLVGVVVALGLERGSGGVLSNRRGEFTALPA